MEHYIKKHDYSNIISIMPKKMKVVDIENASYDDVKDAVVESSVEESLPTEVPVQPSVVEEIPTVTEEVQDEGFVEVKAKKAAAKATCPYCNREMTAKNLKYSHAAICPSRPRESTTDDEVTAPPMLPLVRSATTVEDVVEAEPEQPKPKAKAKAKPRAKKVAVSESPPDVAPEPPKRRSRAAERAQKYEQTVAHALPS